MLRYEFGTGIGDPRSFFELNRRYFGLYAGRDIHDFNRRLERIGGGIGCAYYQDRPASILQTMRFNSRGNNQEIPKTSSELTGDETYSTYNPLGNTLVFVTFAVEPDLRRIPVNGNNLTDAVLEEFLSGYNGAEFKITYSPATSGAVKMHLRHNARPVMRLPNARPGLMIDEAPAEDVIVMGYEWPRYDMSLLGELGIST